MPEQPSWPGADVTDDAELTGAAALARAALLSPAPAPAAERAARELALAQFRQSPPAPRTLRPEDDRGGTRRQGWVRGLLRRLAGK